MEGLWGLLQGYRGFILAVACFFILHHLSHRGRTVLREWPVVGMLPALLANRERLHEWTTDVLRSSGGAIMFKGPWLTGLDFLVTAAPADVSYITSVGRAAKFPKGRDYSEIFDILGDGILNADDDSWRIQRKWAHMLMRQRRFRVYVERTSREKVAAALLPLLDGAGREGKPVDFQEVMQRFTFDATSILVCGVDPGCLSPDFPVVPFAKAVDDAKEVILLRHTVPKPWWKLMRALRVGSERLLAEASATVDRCIAEYINSRRRELAGKEKRNRSKAEEEDEAEAAVDLLTSYMDQEVEEDLERLKSDKFLRDVILNMLVAGRDTTSSALSWFFWELSRNPDVEAKILEEIRSKIGEEEKEKRGELRVFEAEQLSGLNYLHAALCECLRLYPSVPIVHKCAVEADTLPSGHQTAPGMKVFYYLYATARLESVWGKSCRDFRPERWFAESPEKRLDHSDKFFTFNAGPRTCLGKSVSFTHMKTVAAAVLYNFHVDVLDDPPVVPRISVILHMKDGMMVRLRRRHS